MALRFRPSSRQDFALVSRWLAAPHVERWWREDPTLDAIEAGYGPSIDGDDPTELFIVENGGEPVGMIQRYLNADDPGWLGALAPTRAPSDSAGIDYLIGDPDLTGRGLGTAMVDAFVGQLWSRYPSVPAVVVTVSARNPASWRVLEKVGFERTWTGEIDSGHPSDQGVSHCYVLWRPA